MKYGICIIALGYPLYGNSAFNLALSLKQVSKEVPILLVYTPSALSKLSKRELTYFDHFIEIPEEMYMVNGKPQYQRSKLCINQFTNSAGWDYTIYMDADNLWLDRPVSWLFGELSHRDFFIGYNGDYNVNTRAMRGRGYTYWGTPQTIAKHHKIPNHLPQTISGFLFFKNGPKADETFRKALAVYDEPNTPNIPWAAGKPDEYCMNVALGLEDYTQEEAHILYFDNINGTIMDELITKRYWGFATGGNKVSEKLTHLYNKLVNRLCVIADIPTRHWHEDKRDHIEERKKY